MLGPFTEGGWCARCLLTTHSTKQFSSYNALITLKCIAALAPLLERLSISSNISCVRSCGHPCADEEISLLARLAGRLNVNDGIRAGGAGAPKRAAAAAAAKKTSQVVMLSDR